MINKEIFYILILMVLVPSAGAAGDFNIPIPQPTQLTIPTYDGSDQAVHPDVLYFPNGWHDYKYWMAFTPYPNMVDTKENPSIVASNDGRTNWIVPSGVTNPIDPQPVSGSNSDTELVYNEISNKLELYWVESGAGDSILRRKTFNGSTWSSEQTSITVPDYDIMSPAIVRKMGKYKMWYTGGKNCLSNINVKYTDSNDGLLFSPSQNVNIIYKNGTNINKDINVWHINVEYIPTRDEYWMVYAGYPVGSDCGNTDIYFAKALDEINWKTDGVKLLPIRTSFYSMNEYRSAFLFDETTNIMKLWMSGMSSSKLTRIGYSEIPITTEPTVLPTSSPTPTPGPTPTSTYSLVKVGTSSNYYVELISKVSNVKVLFYVDGVLYRTETTARYCLFGGDVCAPGALPDGQHIIVAKTYDKTTGVLLDTQSITIGQGTPTPTPTPTATPVPTTSPIPTPTPTATPGTQYSLIVSGTTSTPYYVELKSSVPNIKVVFYVDGVLYRTETTARYCLFGGDVCAPGTLSAGQHIIAAKTYDKTTGVLLDTQSITIGQTTPSPTATPVPTATPGTQYSLVKAGTSSNYYVELISQVSNVKVLFYVDGVLYRTETIARYCLFGGDVCAPGALSNGQHIIVAKTYDKTTGVLLDTQSITIG